MYLPSETLYMEVIRSREIGDALNALRVFPVSPNTLMMTLQTIALVHKWYEVAKGFEKSRAELAKAQKSFDFFQNQFENVGKSLNKAQEAFETAQRHLKNYRGKVTALSGQEQLELDARPRWKSPCRCSTKQARSLGHKICASQSSRRGVTGWLRSLGNDCPFRIRSISANHSAALSPFTSQSHQISRNMVRPQYRGSSR